MSERAQKAWDEILDCIEAETATLDIEELEDVAEELEVQARFIRGRADEMYEESAEDAHADGEETE